MAKMPCLFEIRKNIYNIRNFIKLTSKPMALELYVIEQHLSRKKKILKKPKKCNL